MSDQTTNQAIARDQQGMTLVEALVAIGIFGIALLGLNALMVGTLRTSELAKDFSTARFLASQRLEQIKNARYQDGDRDAFNDTTDPCTDIDEIKSSLWHDEDYGEVDLLNGTRWTYNTSCANVTDIKATPFKYVRATYPSTPQGDHDFQVNHDQYKRFRREVYIVDSANVTDSIVRVSLSGLSATARDTVNTETEPSSEANPATNFVKYALVRVKWKDSHGRPHHVTLSTEKAFYIPAY
ncbi:MAG: prepilin-type N-terminal cleavage/methylation domain-containing protein [Acidobacteriota bacterium]